MANPSLKGIIDNVRALCEAGEHNRALELLERGQKQSIPNPKILVWKGICSQLRSTENQYQLADVEQMFLKALEIDDESVEALLELGWFYLNVSDDATRAQTFFSKAMEIEKKALTDAIIGLARCLKETASAEEAAVFLEKSRFDAIDSERLNDEIDELRSDARLPGGVPERGGNLKG